MAVSDPDGRHDGELLDVARRLRELVDGRPEPAGWTAVAWRYTERTRDRVGHLVGAAEQLFEIHLPAVPVPMVESQRPHFTYLFLSVESPTDAVGRLLASWVLPRGLGRRRALGAARRRLRDELAKHAGRVRYDMAQRVEAARRELVGVMVAEFDETERQLGRLQAVTKGLANAGAEPLDPSPASRPPA